MHNTRLLVWNGNVILIAYNFVQILHFKWLCQRHAKVNESADVSLTETSKTGSQQAIYVYIQPALHYVPACVFQPAFVMGCLWNGCRKFPFDPGILIWEAIHAHISHLHVLLEAEFSLVPIEKMLIPTNVLSMVILSLSFLMSRRIWKVQFFKPHILKLVILSHHFQLTAAWYLSAAWTNTPSLYGIAVT